MALYPTRPSAYWAPERQGVLNGPQLFDMGSDEPTNYCITGPAIGTGPSHSHRVSCVPPHTHRGVGTVSAGSGAKFLVLGAIAAVVVWAMARPPKRRSNPRRRRAGLRKRPKPVRRRTKRRRRRR